MRTNEPRRYSIEAAALAGFVFAALYAPIQLIGAWVPDEQSAEFADWARDPTNRALAVLAFNLAALGAIAFLWFVVVLRKRLAETRDPLLSTIFDASAVLFLGLALVGLALRVAGIITVGGAVEPDAADIVIWGRAADLVLIIAMPRMQAMFVVSTSTIGRRSGALPGWLVYVGYAFAVTLLVVPAFFEVPGLGFGLWVALVSASLLVRRNQLAAPAGVSKKSREA